MRVPRIAICGPSRCGKDTAAEWFDANTRLIYGLGMSQVIAPHAARYLGITKDEAFACRHKFRMLWYDIGNDLRKDDPAFLVRTVLKGSDIVTGVRDREEIIRARDEGLVDLIVWIDRDVSPDPTLEYGPELCDVRIDNNGTPDEFHRRLAALARFAGLTYLDTVSR